jgi:hypothetical protein
MRRTWLAFTVAATLGFAGVRGAETAAPAPQITLASIRDDMVGMWQNVADPRFTRELDADGRAVDKFGEESDAAPGTWLLFAGSAPPAKLASRKFETNGVYLEIDRDEDTLIYRLASVSRSDMQMLDLDHKALIAFSRLK